MIPSYKWNILYYQFHRQILLHFYYLSLSISIDHDITVSCALIWLQYDSNLTSDWHIWCHFGSESTDFEMEHIEWCQSTQFCCLVLSRKSCKGVKTWNRWIICFILHQRYQMTLIPSVILTLIAILTLVIFWGNHNPICKLNFMHPCVRLGFETWCLSLYPVSNLSFR